MGRLCRFFENKRLLTRNLVYVMDPMTTDPCSLDLVLGTKYGYQVAHFGAKPFKYDLPTLKSIKL